MLVRCAIASCLALGAFFQTQSAAFAATANCTTAEKTQADKQLWLNTRDKKAAIAEHLPWGVPTEPTSADHERLLVQRDYVIDYDSDLRIPIWVGYQLDSSRLAKSKRIDCFRRDPRLNADDASKLSDYDEPIFDQGHLANNADMTSSRLAVINSFVLSNMTPQYHASSMRASFRCLRISCGFGRRRAGQSTWSPAASSTAMATGGVMLTVPRYDALEERQRTCRDPNCLL